LEEYITGVSYFAGARPSRVRGLRDLLHTFGSFVPEAKGLLYFIASSSGRCPRGWEQRPFRGQQLHLRGRSATEAAAESAWELLPRHLLHAGYGWQRRGAKERLFDFNAQLDWECASPPSNQEEKLLFSVNTRLFPLQRDKERSFKLAEGYFECVDRLGACAYAFIDVACVRETAAGHGYGNFMSTRSYSWPRSLEKQLWNDLGAERSRFVRGVYWGNYIGAAMAQAHPGIRRFADEYEASVAASPCLDKPSPVRRFRSGALAFYLNDSPMSLAARGPGLPPGAIACERTGPLLQHGFRKLGLFGW
jgi:hypothetical protein